MDLDWKSIAGAVAPFAPKIGTVLGSAFGPFGGVIGSLAGNAIAATFGVPATPEAVGKAITEDPKADEKLQQLEAERGQEILAQAQVEVERLKQQTAQAQIAADDTNRAREFQARLADSGSPLSWGATIMACAFVLAFMAILGLVIAYPNTIKETPSLAILLGTLTAGVSQILNYFFGSSAGSKDKDMALRQITAAAVPQSPPAPPAIKKK